MPSRREKGRPNESMFGRPVWRTYVLARLSRQPLYLQVLLKSPARAVNRAWVRERYSADSSAGASVASASSAFSASGSSAGSSSTGVPTMTVTLEPISR